MSLTMQEVKHIAELARLDLTSSELQLYQQQLSAILDYAARLKEIDTTGIQPTASVLAIPSRLREDQIHSGLTTNEALQNAPHTQDSQFRVPPVME